MPSWFKGAKLFVDRYRMRQAKQRMLHLLTRQYDVSLSPWTAEKAGVSDLAVPCQWVAAKLSPSVSSLPQRSPTGLTRLQEAIDQSASRLLILGDAGSGKTYALLETLRSICAEEAQKASGVLPFYVNVATWIGDEKDFEKWMTLEVCQQYGARADIIRHWHENDEMAIFLDGLDELRINARREFLRSLNRYLGANRLARVILCCRTEEYRESRIGVALNNSVSMTELSRDAVLDVLRRYGETHASLLAAASSDRPLGRLLQTPLFLALALFAYEGKRGERLAFGKDIRCSILKAFIDKAGQRAGVSDSDFPNSDHVDWLSRLANTCRQKHWPVIYPDRLPLYLSKGPIWEKRVSRWALLTAISLGIVIMTLRLAMVSMFSHDNATYDMLSILTPLAIIVVTRSLIKQEATSPQRGISSLFRERLSRAARIWGVGFAILASLSMVCLLLPNSILIMSVVLGSAILAVAPFPYFLKSSAWSAVDSMPRYPGEEVSALLRNSLGAAAGTLVAMTVALGISFGLYGTAVSGLVPFPLLLTVAFYSVPMAGCVLITNGFGAYLVRRAAVAHAVSEGALPKNFWSCFERFRVSSIFVPMNGGLTFRHSLVRDYLAGRTISRL